MAAVLVISPHGMDEVLGCGGAMARHADAGDRVETLVLFGDGSGLDAGRRRAGPEAAAILGSQPPRFVGFVENRSDTQPLIEVVGAIERAVAEINPATLYVPHGGNLNIDHQTAFRAAITAVRPLPGHPVRTILSYEVPSSTEWAPAALGQPFLPTRFVDISVVLDRKMRALACYAAEVRPAPHARSVDGVRALVMLRGHSVGMAAAEAFGVIRELID